MQRILITGATGFLGRNIAEFFAKNPCNEVIGIWHKKEPFKHDNISWHNIDLRKVDYDDLAFKNVDVLIHCAAVTSGAKDIVERPHIHNADTTLINTNVLKSAFNNKIKNVIFLSCSVMYKPSSVGIKESDYCESDPLNEKYFAGAWLKIYFEKMCKFYSGLYDSKFSVIRHSNIYGPYDKFNSDRSHVFAASISKAFKSQDKFVVWGSGEEKRDFLFVDDLTESLEAVLANQKNRFEIYNIGCGRGVKINELAREIIDCSGRELQIENDLDAPTIPVDLFLNIDKAKKDLNWEPRTSLKEGINKTIEWYKLNY